MAAARSMGRFLHMQSSTAQAMIKIYVIYSTQIHNVLCSVKHQQQTYQHEKPQSCVELQ